MKSDNTAMLLICFDVGNRILYQALGLSLPRMDTRSPERESGQ